MSVRTSLWTIHFLVGAVMAVGTLFLWARFTSGSAFAMAGLFALNGVAIAITGKHDFERKAARTGVVLVVTGLLAYVLTLGYTEILDRYGALAIVTAVILMPLFLWGIVDGSVAVTRHVLRMKDRDPPEGGGGA